MSSGAGVGRPYLQVWFSRSSVSLPNRNKSTITITLSVVLVVVFTAVYMLVCLFVFLLFLVCLVIVFFFFFFFFILFFCSSSLVVCNVFQNQIFKSSFTTKEFKNLKRRIGSLFDPCVNAMGRRPCWPSHMEQSYCTFGFGAIIRRDLRISSLSRDSLRDNVYAYVIKSTSEWQLTHNEIAWRA